MASHDLLTWTELAGEFRGLWDPQDPQFSNAVLRTQGCMQLLLKYNSKASVQLDMVTMKLKLAVLHKATSECIPKSVCQECLLKCKDIPAEVKDFPCLWDPLDLNFTDAEVKAHCTKQLLEKYDSPANSVITLYQLSAKLKKFSETLAKCGDKREHEARKESKIMLTKMLEKYPCLWKHQDPSFWDRRKKAHSRRQLLQRYNSQASQPISLRTLNKRLRELQLRVQKVQQTVKKQWDAELRARSQPQPPERPKRPAPGKNPNRPVQRGNLKPKTRAAAKAGAAQPRPGPRGGAAAPGSYVNGHERSPGPPRCCCCGRAEACVAIADKPYVADDKTTLALNALAVTLYFGPNKHICINCDRNLKEIFDFVTLVKNNQNKFNAVDVLKDPSRGSAECPSLIRLDSDDSDDSRLVVDESAAELVSNNKDADQQHIEEKSNRRKENRDVVLQKSEKRDSALNLPQAKTKCNNTDNIKAVQILPGPSLLRKEIIFADTNTGVKIEALFVDQDLLKGANNVKTVYVVDDDANDAVVNENAECGGTGTELSPVVQETGTLNSQVTNSKDATSEITTSKVTASKDTTSEITTSEVTTSKDTTNEITTSKVTTSEITTGKVTINEIPCATEFVDREVKIESEMDDGLSDVVDDVDDDVPQHDLTVLVQNVESIVSEMLKRQGMTNTKASKQQTKQSRGKRQVK